MYGGGEIRVFCMHGEDRVGLGLMIVCMACSIGRISSHNDMRART